MQYQAYTVEEYWKLRSFHSEGNLKMVAFLVNRSSPLIKLSEFLLGSKVDAIGRNVNC